MNSRPTDVFTAHMGTHFMDTQASRLTLYCSHVPSVYTTQLQIVYYYTWQGRYRDVHTAAMSPFKHFTAFSIYTQLFANRGKRIA